MVCVDSNSQDLAGGGGRIFFKEMQCSHILYVHESLLLSLVLKERKNVYRQKSPFQIS